MVSAFSSTARRPLALGKRNGHPRNATKVRRDLKIFRDGLLFAIAVLCASGCSHGSGGTPASHAAPTLGMVTDVGGLGDKSFNDSAYRGLQRAQSKLGTRISVLQSRSVSDYEPNLSALAEQGDALVFAIGFLMHDSLGDVAQRFPQTHFAIIDSVVDAPNVTSVTFREEQSSFLAGVVAGLVTKTGSVGFLGGIQSPLIEKFEAGFTAGVQSANPKAQVLVKYTGSFDDVASEKSSLPCSSIRAPTSSMRRPASVASAPSMR